MGSPRKILFLCSSDYGQANVVLATAHAIFVAAAAAAAGERQPLEIHIGSEHCLAPEVERARRLVDAQLPGTAPHGVHFHGIDGDSQFKAMTRPKSGLTAAWELPLPSFANAAAFFRRFSYGAMPWEPDEVVDMYAQVMRLIRDVGPDLTVVDPIHTPALTAAHNMCTGSGGGQAFRWTVLAPNTIRDFAVTAQPWAAALWKYPAINTALPFPLPWHQVPMNAGLLLLLAWTMLTDTRTSRARKLLREWSGNPRLELLTLAELGVVRAPPPGLRLLCAFSEDLDFPLRVIPRHITPCGPIVRPALSLTELDAPLERWLARGPTVYVNLGTQFTVKPREGLEFALALRDLLATADESIDFTEKGTDKGQLQVLWKLQRKDAACGEEDGPGGWEGEWKAVYDCLEAEISTDRVRITPWVKTDPCAVLHSGHIVCSVHHGGANSHHEALAAGVPHVIVAGWLDCYDFGIRVELSGIGIWANKGAAPRWQRTELGSALERVVVTEKDAYLGRAREMAERHPENAGRDKAAAIILEMLGGDWCINMDDAKGGSQPGAEN